MKIEVEDLKIIETIPDETWVERLRQGNVIRLVKEQMFAIVEQEFDPPEPGYTAGRLVLRKFWPATGPHARPGMFIGELPPDGFIRFINNETWFIRADGSGLDFKPLILPVVGHLADDPPPIDEPIVRQMKRTIANLEHRVLILERGLWMANALSGLTPTTNYPRRKKP